MMKTTTKALTSMTATALALTASITPAFASNTTNTVAPTPTTANAAINLRITLDNLLAEHSTLAIRAMEDGYSNAPEFSAVANQLSANTDALSAAIASVYGADAGAQFKKMWSDHIGFFVDYVTATAKNDSAGQQTALNNLQQYKVQFSNFLSSATKLPASALADGLQMHVNQLLTAFTDYVNKDYTGAEQETAVAYNHMFATGDALAGAIVKEYPSKFGAVATDTSAANLRVALDNLLGLHAMLAIMAMEKGYAGAPDYSAVAGVLGQNTTDLSNAIASVYGTDAGAAFNKMWSDHIGFFVDYVTATAQGNDAAKQQALDNLAQYKTQFSQFLAGANPNLNATALSDGLQTHVNQLLGAFNDYASKDYAGAETNFDAAYNHMFMTGDGLSAAIVQQFPSKFEDAKDTFTWTSLHFNAKGMDVTDPLGIWGVNPTTNQNDVYVPIWYVMRTLDHVGVQSMWNGTTWQLTSKESVNLNDKFTGGTKSIMINGQSAGTVDSVVTLDPYGKVSTQFMAESDVTKIIADLGLTATWSSQSTLNVQ